MKQGGKRERYRIDISSAQYLFYMPGSIRDEVNLWSAFETAENCMLAVCLDSFKLRDKMFDFVFIIGQ